MRKIIDRIFISLIFLFLYAPIVVLIIFSFNDSRSRTVWSGFTFKWYQELFSDRVIMSAFSTTITVAVLAAVIATVIGTFAAIGIHAMRKRPKQVVLTLNNIPVLNPDIITGVSLMLLFVFARVAIFPHFGINFELGFFTLLLAHITFNVPYVILCVLPKLRQMNNNLYDAALDLGAGPMLAFKKVILPQITPGVITGLMMAFTLSVDDFVVSYFVSGSKVETLAVAIYSMTRKRISPKINALSTIMFLVVLTLLIIINIRQSNDQSKKKNSYD